MKAEILNDHQKTLLEQIAKLDYLRENFYLTGGSALAAFYLEHRYSEDLDFFSTKEIDFLSLTIAADTIKKHIGAKKIDFEQSYNRNLIFFHFCDQVLKTEFTYFPFPPLEKGIIRHGVIVDSLLDIAVNKLFAIYQRSVARDYIDLFFICKEKGYKIEDLVKKAKAKFDWHIDFLQLGTQFIKADSPKDYPYMIKECQPQEWQEFFLQEAKKLKSKILK
ncbi:MAG: hypothetical protein D6687_01970 [Acidobacteria bacterium]|jgi:predicted nucleotidyltransferase component of viral defense system|nr:MAG: hypothetical protein D6687_01970 [Acidobacteriota bacterium]GIU81864.1 MAG: hypothetical protein KatS3mg006_0928 [Pyrinomonadaceae bacterium]